MKTIKIVAILMLLVGVCALSFAAESNRIATVSNIKGNVEVKVANGSWKSATQGEVLNPGDVIRTADKSSAVLNLDGDAKTASVDVKEKSQLKISELMENKKEGTQKTLLDLALGEVLIHTKKLDSEKSRFEVKTPTSIVGVRGTTFSVAVENKE